MTRSRDLAADQLVNRQAAHVLLSATFAFLRRNRVPDELITDFIRTHFNQRRERGDVRRYRKQVSNYEEMGIIMSTWHSLPRFLDESGRPIPLSLTRGRSSVASLVRYSRVRIPWPLAVELMRRSPSIAMDKHGNLMAALKRAFVLPGFEIPRAALVIERYLDTLGRNSSARKNKTSLLLEKNCWVPEVDLTTIAPVLRDIKDRGSALIHSIDGEIERRRLRRPKNKGVGEMGLLIFSWTRPRNARSRTRQT
jgi:hypothetical protein